MRFITEFEFPLSHSLEDIESRRKYFSRLLGEEISKLLIWRNPVNGNRDHHRLEIEAFPMDKWIEFRNKLWGECTMPCPNGTDILEMLKELESFGKPSGDAIANQQLNK